ncbi:hypothetical protein ACJX0J_036930, partial [Zea mays]
WEVPININQGLSQEIVNPTIFVWFYDYSHSIQFKRNLISLGTLEAMGFKFSVDNVDRRINNLYYLHGSTVIGTPTTFLVVSTGRKIKKLRTDNRLGFCNNEFDS